MDDRAQTPDPSAGYDSASDPQPVGTGCGSRVWTHTCTTPPSTGPQCQGGARGPCSQGLHQGLPGASLQQPGPRLPMAGWLWSLKELVAPVGQAGPRWGGPGQAEGTTFGRVGLGGSPSRAAQGAGPSLHRD